MYWLPPSAGEAVGKDDDRRRHLLLVDEPRRALGNVLAERLPVGVGRAAAHEADEIEQDRKARFGELGRVVLRRQPDGQRPHARVAERIAPQHLRAVLDDDDAARLGEGVLGRQGEAPGVKPRR
jgi:hypothetical protein